MKTKHIQTLTLLLFFYAPNLLSALPHTKETTPSSSTNTITAEFHSIDFKDQEETPLVEEPKDTSSTGEMASTINPSNVRGQTMSLSWHILSCICITGEHCCLRCERCCGCEKEEQ